MFYLFALLGLDITGFERDSGWRFLGAAAVAGFGLVWFATRENPFTVAIVSFCVALVLNACLATPGTPLGALGAADRYLTQATQFLMLVASLSAYVVSLSLFEKRHLAPLMRWRRRWGLVLSELSAKLALAKPDSLDSELDHCLRRIGLHARADRCKLLEIDREANTFSETRRWVRDGVEDTKDKLQNKALAGLTMSLDQIESGKTIYVTQSDLEEGSDHLKIMRETNAQASAYAPIRINGVVQGAMTLTWVGRQILWSNETALIVQNSAQIVGSAISRVRNEIESRTYRNKLQKLAAELERTDEQVRRQTATDIHDGALQSLAVARMKLGALRDQDDRPKERIEDLEQLLRSATQDLRGIMQRMFPTVLYELGLKQALIAYARDASTLGEVPIEVDISAGLSEPNKATAFLLYQTCRELVTNALKHADASRIAIDLHYDNAQVVLEVMDDGVGMRGTDISKALARGDGLGLFALRERFERADGSIYSKPARSGTHIVAKLPME